MGRCPAKQASKPDWSCKAQSLTPENPTQTRTRRAERGRGGQTRTTGTGDERAETRGREKRGERGAGGERRRRGERGAEQTGEDRELQEPRNMQTCLTHASATPQKGDHPTGCPGHSSNAHMQGRQACKCKCSTKARRETRRGRNRQAEASNTHTDHAQQATHRNDQAKQQARMPDPCIMPRHRRGTTQQGAPVTTLEPTGRAAKRAMQVLY